MEHSGDHEGVNDWENIQPATAHWDDNDDNDMVVVHGSGGGGPISKPGSVFPPNNHEDLPVSPPHTHQHQHQHQDPPANPALSEEEVGWGIGERSIARLGILSSGIVRIAYGIRRHAVRRAGILSFTGMVAVVLAAVYGRRWLRWRRQVEADSKNQLMLLIKQKDEKINQLLLQIARMNKILSTPRRVPILRLVVNSSHIVIP